MDKKNENKETFDVAVNSNGMEAVIDGEKVNVVMDEETMQAIIEDNMHLVPKNQLKRFEGLSLEGKLSKIQWYQEIEKIREEVKVRNSIGYRVKELFEKRKATVEDAKEVLRYCTEFIDNFKQRQIEDIDRQIAELEELKRSL